MNAEKKSAQDETFNDRLNQFCSPSLFAHLAEDSSYWKKAYGFYMEHGKKPFRDLSEKQQTWASRIISDLIDEANKNDRTNSHWDPAR